jgi:hypothetical protein
MERMKFGNNNDALGDSYAKPSLERIGSFRELTKCGELLGHLAGRHHHHDDCGLKGSSAHDSVHHGH